MLQAGARHCALALFFPCPFLRRATKPFVALGFFLIAAEFFPPDLWITHV
jgi:hypothetical protein